LETGFHGLKTIYLRNGSAIVRKSLSLGASD
jgi:hypothetical protein